MSESKVLTAAEQRNLETICLMMVETQAAQNRIVNPLWHTKEYPFMRAAWTEASEAMGHLTWEWWKNLGDNYYDAFRAQGDIAEFHMELVDCLHFLISDLIQTHVGKDELISAFSYNSAAKALYRMLLEGYAASVSDGNVEVFAPVSETPSTLGTPEQTVRRTEALVNACLNSEPRSAFASLIEVAEYTELGLAGLLGRYFAKATLNKHRWANGYKEKTYIKNWGDGKEDNYFLNHTVISQLEGVTLPEICENLADGSWTEELAEDLRDMYRNVVDNGHAHHASAMMPT